MRRQRSIQYPLAFLTVALGVGGVSSAARAAAGEDPGPDAAAAPVDDAPAAPAPPAPETTVPAPDPEPEPTTPPTTEPAPDPEPEPTTPPTTEPAPEPAPEPTTEPEPEPTTPEVPEPTTPEVPEPSEPSSPPSDSPTPSQPDQPDELDQPATADGIDGITRPISFPVLGTVQYANGWGDCRDGCSRRHVGTDMLGVRMQPLLAAVDGTVTRIQTDAGISGNGITVTGADGWYYNYFHVNNDTPGTDDGLAAPHWQVSPKLTVGSRVRAGQVIGYMGDSGNAEGSVPHLHFEIRTPDRTPVNPYPSLVAAQERETCEPIEGAWTNSELASLSPSAVAVIPLAGGGRWVIDGDGRLHAEGPAADVQPIPGVNCDAVKPLVAAGPPAPDFEVTPAAKPAPAVPAPAPVVKPAPAAPAPAPVVTPAPPVDDPALTPTSDEWTVEPGDSLWYISQESYGVSDTVATVSVVDFVFENNRDQLSDPDVLEIGTKLELPPILL
jgi:murein DD-endopeptidase MepM/ murein hydrolase activator NlpD